MAGNTADAPESEGDAKPEAVRTGADRLLELVKSSREMALADAAQRLGVTAPTVEAWANFLEEDGLIAIKYKFTTPYLYPPEAPKSGAKSRLLGLVSEGLQGLEGIEKAGELVDVKAYVESAKDLLAKASEEKTIGEFGLLRQTYADLLAKLRLAHDRLAAQPGIAPQKRVALSEFLKRLDSMLMSASGYVSRGRFDQANISYSDLQKQAAKAAEELNQVYEQMVTVKTVQETKDYKELLEKVYQLMEEGRLEEATQLYDKLKFAHENLAKEFVEKKQHMEEDLVKLNKDLAKKADQLNIKKLGEQARRISLLLDSGRQFLGKGEFDTAESYYLAIKQEYAKLPPGFAKEKKDLQEKVLGFYSSLASQREKELKKVFDRAARQVESMIKESQGAVNENRTADAIRLYNQVRLLFTRLPKGFLKEKSELQEKILPLYTAITSEYTRESLRKLKSKSAEIISLLSMMNEHTAKGELRAAEDAYERIKKLYREMPEGFLHEETTLQNQIVQAYEAYLKKTRQLETTTLASALSAMSRLLGNAEANLKKGDYEAANGAYLEIIGLYGTLPTGFMAQKTEVRERILRLYKSLLSESYLISQGQGLGNAGRQAAGMRQKRLGTASATAAATAAVPMPGAQYYEPAHKPAPVVAITREVPASELLEKPQAIQAEQREEGQGEEPAEAESLAADEGGEDEDVHDSQNEQNLDTEMEGIQKKIEELKGLSRATVKLPR